MGLDVVEFVLWAEEKYGVDIPDVDAAEIVTVGQFCRYISGRLAIKAAFTAPSYRAILDDVSHELVTSFGVKRDLISEQARFVKDLGLD